jgi:hypothetical protein
MQNASAAHQSFALVRRFARFVVVGAMLGAGGMTSVQAGIKSEKFMAAILAQTPAPVIVSQGQQLKEAEKAAANIPGAETFWGVGESMEPLYTSSTAIIIAPVNFSALKKGMTVVYMNSRGRMVAHSLKTDMPKGWIAQGVNNDREDHDLVTKKNLIGVIVKAYSASETDFRIESTKRLAAKAKTVGDSRT